MVKVEAVVVRERIETVIDAVEESTGHVGVMSIAWMVIISAAIFVEKVFPWGERLTWVLGVVLLGLAIWIAVSPGSVPWLVEPGQANMGGMDMSGDMSGMKM